MISLTTVCLCSFITLVENTIVRLQHPIYFKHYFCVALSANFIFQFEHNYGLLVKVKLIIDQKQENF